MKPIQALCRALALIPLMCAHVSAQVPDLTSGGVKTDNEHINLGPTGMEGWIYNAGSGKLQETAAARQILVTKVDVGSPADGILASGDVILGADGTGAEPVNFTSDARKALAYAIDAAEGNNPALLKLIRWRSGLTTTVSITLEYMGGSYSATAPYNCAKSAAILEKGIDYIMSSEPGSGYGGFGSTVLMAVNDPNHPDNAARQARAQAEAHALNLTQGQIDDMTSGDLTRSIGKPWSIGPQLIAQAEYYLQTGDSAVLPSIRARAIQIADAQSLFGTMGHHYSLPGPNGEVNSAYGIGYGPVNNAGMPCFIGLILAKKCGLTDPEIVAGIDRAAKYFQYYADLGTVPYGENKETGSISNNGKSGLAAISLGMIEGYESQSKYFAKMSVYGADERDSGHTGPFFNQLWTPLAANLGGDDALARYFNQTSWLYDLARRWNGAFVYQPYYQSGGISVYGQDHRASWTTLLTYAAPLAKIHITGKDANPALALDAVDMADINHAIAYNAATRTTAQLLEDLAHPLPQLHWSAGNEIGANRIADHAAILPTLINMAQNGATFPERHGAIYTLGKIKDDSTAPVLAGLCGSPNSKVRYMAANALSGLSMSAKTAQVATIVNGLISTDRPMLPLDPENPMHVEKMSFATLLFDSSVGIWGGSRVTTADRALFYPAFRIIAGAPMGVTVRDKAFSVAPYLTKTDVEQLADLLVGVASGPSPAENSYTSSVGAIEAMQVNDIAEGVPAAVHMYSRMTKNQNLPLKQLENYAGSSLTVQPDPGVIEFCKRLVSSEDPYFFGEHNDDDAQAILDAIAADQLPERLTPFKKIDWVFADQPSLTLPSTTTVLRVQSTDLAKGNSFYTWRKVHGAGEVSFTPNGTAAAKNATVLFDGTPGVYTFEVTMADDKGFTEAYGTVTVNLKNSGGSLPSDSAPTADAGSVTAGKGTPTPVLLTGSDPESQNLIYTVTNGPSHGHLSGTAPHLIYTSDLAYTGADSFTFEVMDTEGLKSSATVNITVSPVAAVGLALYEPFAYPTGGFNGSSSVNEIGLTGTWNAQSNMNVIGGSLNYGSLVTNGGALTASNSANSHAASRAINPSALAGNNLLSDGSTLWFSAVLGHPGMVSTMYLALANSQFSNSAGNHYIVNEGAQLGSGLGVWVNNSQVYATQFLDSAQSGPNAGTWSGEYGTIKSGVQRLVVGKITWGAASDTMEIYLPWDDLVLPSTPSSTLTANVNQSTFDTLAISRNGTPLIDEIRFGATYQSVIQGTAAMVADTAAPTPNPMTFAVAPKPAGPSSITMTATPAFDASAVEYSFTCTAGGGDSSGWQDSPVYTDTGLTPGVQYSYTVKARDMSPARNETAASAAASATIPTLATVPNLVGILQSSAESLIAGGNLTVGTITTATQYSLTVPAGHVLSQTPAASSTAAYGSAVNLEISIGQDPALPTLAAVDIVDDQNGGPVVVNTAMAYTLTFSEDMNDATVNAADFANLGTSPITIGAITETSPGVFNVEVTPTGIGPLRFGIAASASLQDAQGDAFNTTYALIDDTVILIQLPPVTVPNVVGMAQAAAESAITAANLVVGTINSIYDALVPVGNVIYQTPASGGSIPGQSAVNLVVSLGPPPDTIGPVVASISPADGAYNVEANANLQVTFNENVFANSGNIIIRNLNDGSDIIIPVSDETQVLTYANILTINPTVNLGAGESYAVRISAGAVVDESGNGFLGINDNRTWNFSTALSPLANVLFAENFEAPNVTAYSQGTTPTTWVKANQGFGATSHGLTDKAGGNFSAPDPNHQAYAFRYGNTGITTAEGVAGTITADTTYEVSFDVIQDLATNGIAYSARMLAYTAGTARNDCRSNGTAIQLATTTGNATTNGFFTTVTFQTTVAAGSSAIGRDFALRFIGSGTSAIVDNVVIRTISPSAPDQVPPAIASLTPADDSEQVSVTDNLKIVFDENIDIGAGFITIKNLSTTSQTVINVIDGTKVLINGDTLEINPAEDFDSNTFYSVRIGAGAITDLAGNGIPGIHDDTSWIFNTGEVSDGTAPSAVAFTPADGATGVSYSTSFGLTFDENVVVGSGNITLKNLTDATELVINAADASQVSASGQNVTINPASYLGEGKHYAVRIDAGVILDLAGNPYAGISDDTTWEFTTSANNPPAIVSVSPSDESVNVDIASNLNVTFDEPIAAGTGNITIRNVITSSNLVISVNDATQVSINGAVLTINSNSNLGEATNYAVLIDNGAIEDLNDNVFAGIASDAAWNFATGVSLEGLAFFDDFEVSSGSPNVDAAGSAGNTSKQTGPDWVRATVAFGATNHGIVDESSGQFTDPTGEQAYAFRYTNSGITTVQDAIGTLAAGKSYRVSFNVVGDGYNNGGAYEVGLVTFAPGAARTDMSGMGNGTSRVLATRSGNFTGSAYQLVSFEYTSTGVADAAVQGHDLAIRLRGGSNTANIDNVQITINDSVIDVIAPTLASSDIVDNQGGGPIEMNTMVTYTLTFSEDMDAATVSAADFANAGSASVTIGAISEVVPGVFSVQVTPSNPGSLVLSVPSGAVLKDVAGNSLVTTTAITDNTTITVTSPPDLVPPTLVSVNPPNSATDVTVSSNLTATFSESIAKGTGNITIKNLTDATDIIIDVASSEVTASGSVLTINPAANLLSGKNYAVWIAATAVKDLADNTFAGINNNSVWGFTTEVVPYVWTQTAGGAQNWTTGSNWLGGTVPDPIAGDAVDFSTVNIGSNTTLTLGADRTAAVLKFGDTSGTQTWTVNSGNTLTLAGGTPTIHATTGTTLANVVAGSGGIVKTGGGTLNLSNTANTFTGDVVVNAGNLTVNTNGSLGGSSGVVFTANGTLTVSTSGHTLSRSLALNNNAVVNISMAGTATISGAVTGNGGIISPTTLILGSTANAFTGPITMGSGFAGATLTANSLGDGGLVYLGSQDNYGSSTFIYGTGATAPMVLNQRQFVLGGQGRTGTFDYSATIKNNNATAANTVTINSDMIIGGVASVNNRRLVLSGTNTGENKFTGLLGDGVGALASEITSLAKLEAGTWAVSGANNFTGPVTIKAGRLVTNHVADAGFASPLGASNDSFGMGLLLYGGTLQYAPVNGAGATGHSTNRNLLIAASSTIDASGTGALQFTKTGDLSPDLSAQTITTTSGSPVVTVASTAGLAEGMTVKYNGGASTGVIGSINSSTQYSLTANAAAAGTFGDATYGYPAARTLTLSGNSTASNSIAGNLRNSTASGTGVLSLTKSGVGTWALNGANTYTGVTTVNDGTLLINGNSASATGAVAVNNSATIGGGGTIGGTVTVAASAKVAPGNNVGTLAINGGLNISAMAGGAGTVNYDLDAIGASDRITVGGTFTIGTAALGFEDFVFTNAGGLNNGTYTLVTYNALSGTLKSGAALTGPVGNGSGTLQISGNSLQLVVSGVTVPDTTPPTLAASDIVDDASGGPVPTGSVVTYTLTFSEDIDGATVTAADFGNAGSASITIGTITEIDPGVFTLQVTPSTGGTLQLKVNAGAVISDVAGNALNTASEIADNTTITVNSAPVWAENPVNETDASEDSAYSASLSDAASDANNDVLTFAKINGPAWLDVAADGTLSGIPENSDVGTNNFTVSVSDGIAPAVEATLEITVINTNDAPVFASNPFTGNEATEDAAYSGSIAGSASDVDAGATLVYAKVSGPAWLSVAGNGTLSGTPSDSDVGANSFTVSVSDGIAPAVEASLEIEVINTNDAPVFAANPVPGADATEDAAYSGTLAGSANDDDEDGLTYAKVSGPVWLSVAANGTLSGTPENSDVGVNSFTVSVSDGIAPAVEGSLEIEVINTNDAPVFAANPISGADATEDEGYIATLAGSATDDDEDGLTYAKVSGPAWLSVAANGDLSGTPENSDVGDNSFTVSVSDGIDEPVEATLEIEVINTNDAPVFAANPISGADATEDAAYSGTLAGSANDDDEDDLTYAKVSGPAWLSVAADGTLSGTPQNSDVGANNFTVSVSDGIAPAMEATLEIEVINTNDAPVFTTNPVTGGSATENAAYSGTLAGSATDVDAGATLTYAKVSGPAWLNVSADGALSGTPGASNVGANRFIVSVSDGIAPPQETALDIQVSEALPVLVFADNFEPGTNSFGGTTSDVTTYNLTNTSQSANTALWVRATSGFGGNRNGLLDESEDSGANFTDPAGTQAYGFRYTNSGVTTAAGKLGSLEAGKVIHVSFDAVRDGWNGGRAYDAMLVLFNSGAARHAVEFGAKGTAAVLARSAGSVPADSGYHRITLSYTVGDDVVDNNGETSGIATGFLSSLLGKDLALRFDGATDSANIDNVEITIDSSSTATPASVPDITGLAEANAASAILAANLVTGIVWEQHSLTVAEGNVISQSPTAGTQLAGGSVVDYVISLGLPMVTVPNVVGLTQSAAQTTITAASLTTGDVTEAYSDTVPAGAVISQGLAPASSVPYGSQVDLVISLGLDFTPKLVRTTINAVSNTSWTTVDLGRAYHSPVVITTPIYPNATLPPVVTRITNVTSTGFDVRIERTDGLTDPVSIEVSIVAVDEGVYTLAEHGVTMEAVKFTSVITSRKGSWVAEACGYQNTYVNPVVVGQVMSANDARWSVFWSMGATTANPADASNLNVGKHIGEDTVTTRADETIGYIVIEAGSGTIDGIDYEAGLGADTVQGFDDSTTPYTYTLSGNLGFASSAATAVAGMQDDDGAWAVLSGSPALTTTSIGLHACEDKEADAEQSHATEQIGYLIFE